MQTLFNMKIEEYELIKLIKNQHPNNLERTLDYYARSIKDIELRKAIIAALFSKCLPQELEHKYVQMFRRPR